VLGPSNHLGKIGMKVGAMEILKEKKIFFNYFKNTSCTFFKK
jgi:hypothetical protein